MWVLWQLCGFLVTCVLVFTLFFIVGTLFLYFLFMYIYSYFLAVLVLGLLPPSVNSFALNNNNNNKQCFCVCECKQLYLGSHSQLDNVRMNFFNHNDRYYHLPKVLAFSPESPCIGMVPVRS